MLHPADLGLLLLTLLLGALLSRTSLCTVAGIREVVVERSGSGMRRILAASSAAGCLLLASYLLAPSPLALPRALPIAASVLLGGALLGIGALVNGACYLGSVLYLGRGNFNFLFTLAGLALAARAASAPAMSSSATRPVLAPTLGLVSFALLLAFALRPAWRGKALTAAGSQRLPLMLAAATGACAGLVSVLHPGWSYGVVIEALAQHRAGMWLGLAAAVLMFAGAWAGSLLQHSFQAMRFQPVRATRCLAGGLVMGYGASRIPGGNDSLLLWAIPGLTLYGLIAYVVMACVIAAAFLIGLQRQRA